jgi:hypothetical protein
MIVVLWMMGVKRARSCDHKLGGPDENCSICISDKKQNKKKLNKSVDKTKPNRRDITWQNFSKWGVIKSKKKYKKGVFATSRRTQQASPYPMLVDNMDA